MTPVVEESGGQVIDPADFDVQGKEIVFFSGKWKHCWNSETGYIKTAIDGPVYSRNGCKDSWLARRIVK